MMLAEALALGNREVISLVGGGGKTTLMYALGRELSVRRGGAILTTTTKIREPEPEPWRSQLISRDLVAVLRWVEDHIRQCGALLIAQARLTEGKLEGIPPEWIEALFRTKGVSVIVNEADGAAGRPLKAPREEEPVVPQNTTLLVPVIGIDGQDCPLEERWVFRSSLASRLIGLPMGRPVTAEAVARLLCLLLKDRPPGARIVPVINKIDCSGGREKAERLARHLFAADLGIRQVLLGKLRYASEVEVLGTAVHWLLS